MMAGNHDISRQYVKSTAESYAFIAPFSSTISGVQVSRINTSLKMHPTHDTQ